MLRNQHAFVYKFLESVWRVSSYGNNVGASYNFLVHSVFDNPVDLAIISLTACIVDNLLIEAINSEICRSYFLFLLLL